MNYSDQAATAKKKERGCARSESLWAFRNFEGYIDSTAGRALEHVYREEMERERASRDREKKERKKVPHGKHKEYVCRHEVSVVRYFELGGGYKDEG